MFDKLFLQRQFADQLASRLQGWRVQSYSPYRANFRCPICGDSQKNKFKKRGYILEAKGYLTYHCHNACGTIGFEKYLKDHHGDLYSMYRLDLLRMNPKEEFVAEEVVEVIDEVESINIDLDSFMSDPRAYDYIVSRKIPNTFWDDIFYTEKFYKFINTKIEDKFDEKWDHRIDERVVFPLRWFNGEVFGVIGRAIDPNNQLRYLTIKFDNSKPKIFGLDRVNRFNDIFCVEGPIDSFFIDNAIALAGTDGNPQEVFDKSQVVMVLDNQPRAKDVLKKYEKYIDQGYRMVVWPSHISGKDPNEIILNNELTVETLNTTIKQHTYESVMLKIKFNSWRKN